MAQMPGGVKYAGQQPVSVKGNPNFSKRADGSLVYVGPPKPGPFVARGAAASAQLAPATGRRAQRAPATGEAAPGKRAKRSHYRTPQMEKMLTAAVEHATGATSTPPAAK